MKEKDLLDLKKYLLSKKEADKIAEDFNKNMIAILRKNLDKIFTLKGAPSVNTFSTAFGRPYVSKIINEYRMLGVLPLM